MWLEHPVYFLHCHIILNVFVGHTIKTMNASQLVFLVKYAIEDQPVSFSHIHTCVRQGVCGKEFEQFCTFLLKVG